MEKSDLVKLLNDIFIPIGFKRKGNNWVSNSDEISKIVNLQKSNYGNAFYINYGFVIKELLLTTTTHVENRLASTDEKEQKRITELLNLDNDIQINERLLELRQFIANKIIHSFQAVNTETDLLTELKKRPHLNDIPLVVKRYFNLS